MNKTKQELEIEVEILELRLKVAKLRSELAILGDGCEDVGEQVKKLVVPPKIPSCPPMPWYPHIRWRYIGEPLPGWRNGEITCLP